MTLKPLVVVAACVVALGTLLSSTTRAFTVQGATWSATAIPVPYYVNPANMDLPAAAIEPAIRTGADAWHVQSGSPFAFVFAGFSTQTVNTNDGVNVVMFRNASNGSVLATTYSWFSGSRMIDADIVFWDAGFQFVTGTSGCSNAFFIEDIATHEFGHALGLGHTTVASATMYPSISTCSQQGRTLDADDIAGVLSLYPATTPPTPPTGLRIIK
jgi:hypothetical protein